MATNPVEENFITRFILGIGVIVAMMVGGGAGGHVLRNLDLPYGGAVGVTLGALFVFIVFIGLYRRYDAAAE
jgi:hypothetical protein